MLDLRVIAPLDPAMVIQSVAKTGRLVAIDGGWRTCGLASEILAQVAEHVPPSLLKENCVRVTLPDAPAPTSRALERLYYSSIDDVVAAARSCVGNA